jgi:hypothetical protein
VLFTKEGLVFASSNSVVYKIECGKDVCKVENLQKESEGMFSWLSWSKPPAYNVQAMHITGDGKTLYVLTEQTIEKWSISSNNVKFDMDVKIMDNISKQLNETFHETQKIYVLDMNSKGDKTYILTGSIPKEPPKDEVPLANYCIWELDFSKQKILYNHLNYQPDYDSEDDKYYFQKVKLCIGKLLIVVWNDILVTSTYGIVF